MIPEPFQYENPATLAEALDLLRKPGARALAGGMSLVPMMKLRLAAPEIVVDLQRIPGLTGIDQVNGHLRIGAMSTHAALSSRPSVRSACPLLAECAASIGDVQVRNAGTIGGSVAHADPAADYPAALLALEASVVISGPSGERAVSAEEFFVDTFTTDLAPGELITGVVVPREHSSTGTAYEKKIQPASGFAMVGIAARVQVIEARISSVRIGVTGLTGKPYRAYNVEQLLEGSAGTPADIAKAASVIADGTEPNSDIHASSEYRAHLARVFATRAISRALRLAGAAA
jgi:aerobic carbon-monoxide dehydrogenase medium subunit